MQNSLKILFFLFFLFSSSLFAKELKVVYKIAFVGMAMDYSEYDDNGALFDTEESSLHEIGGVDMGYHFFFDYEDNSYSELNFDVLYVSGYTDYTGSLLNSNNPFGSFTSKTLNDVIDISFRYQNNQQINKLMAISYGLGIGYRYWQRQLSRTQVEGYEWFSLRPLVGIDFNIVEGTYLNFNAEYQYGLNPSMSASNVSSDFDLGGANILKLKVGLAYIVTEHIDMYVDAVFERQKITKSNTIEEGTKAYYEPDSTAYNKYLKVGIAFKY